MTAPVRRTTVPSAVGENRKRIQILEATPPPTDLIQMRPPALMGWCMYPAAVTTPDVTPTLRCRGAYAYRLDEDLDLVAGDFLNVSYNWRSGAFYKWVGARAHLVTGLKMDTYNIDNPNGSNPHFGSRGSYFNPTPYVHNFFMTYMAVTNDDTDTVTWTAPAAVGAEQYGWDVSGAGHIGYAFHDFTGTGTNSADTASFSGAATEKEGSITTMFAETLGAPVTVGAMVGENETTQISRGVPIELTQDVPAGSVMIIVVASQDWEFSQDSDFVTGGGDPVQTGWGFQDQRPFVYARAGSQNVETTPHYFANGQWWPMTERLGDHIQNQ